MIGVSSNRPLFRKLDCLLLRVADLDAAISFYRDRLGPETDVLVENVDEAFALFLSAGGEPVQPPFEIAIGRCARVRDPFGNELVLLDQSKGTLATDRDGRVVGVLPKPPGRER
jgi:catechol 2,3-dioxygenase-like lactoylglutathione lyase family enzyme